MQILLLLSIGIEKNKARAQLIAMSHNLKTGVDIFKAMWRLKGLRSCYVQ
jgi:IS5 family transposase